MHLAIAYERAPEPVKQKMVSMIQARMQAAASNHPLTRQAELRFFGWLQPAHPAILEMATKLFGSDDQAKGERLMQPLLYGSSAELREQALVLMRQTRTLRTKPSINTTI